mmetsp:Transcript_116343/g.324164  ORF Transcript_116343/g.324164 Transcript_116343/m.324164 type:complete len:222 (-) Transcript_116343:1134-1799(-)
MPACLLGDEPANCATKDCCDTRASQLCMHAVRLPRMRTPPAEPWAVGNVSFHRQHGKRRLLVGSAAPAWPNCLLGRPPPHSSSAHGPAAAAAVSGSCPWRRPLSRRGRMCTRRAGSAISAKAHVIRSLTARGAKVSPEMTPKASLQQASQLVPTTMPGPRMSFEMKASVRRPMQEASATKSSMKTATAAKKPATSASTMWPPNSSGSSKTLAAMGSLVNWL